MQVNATWGDPGNGEPDTDDVLNDADEHVVFAPEQLTDVLPTLEQLEHVPETFEQDVTVEVDVDHATALQDVTGLQKPV